MNDRNVKPCITKTLGGFLKQISRKIWIENCCLYIIYIPLFRLSTHFHETMISEVGNKKGVTTRIQKYFKIQIMVFNSRLYVQNAKCKRYT